VSGAWSRRPSSGYWPQPCGVYGKAPSSTRSRLARSSVHAAAAPVQQEPPAFALWSASADLSRGSYRKEPHGWGQHPKSARGAAMSSRSIVVAAGMLWHLLTAQRPAAAPAVLRS
jgi:hypothetical protein